METEDLKYHKEHCWVRVDGENATIGISEFAQEELGEIVYIDPVEAGEDIEVSSEFTEIESTKTTAPVISPISGTLVDLNEELKDSPELINEDPYGKGWIAVIKMSNKSELDDLMSEEEYDEYKSDR